MNWFRYLFALDLRALALMRIAIGTVLLFDLIVRFTDYIAFYSDYGILPREAQIMLLHQKDFISLYSMSGEPYFIVTLFAISFWAYFHVLIGKKTRIYTIISWVLLLSIQNRNTLIGQAGDDVLRLALMWGIFLPLSKHYSWDSKNSEPSNNHIYFSWSTVGLTLLIFSLYFFSACLKRAPEWTTDFTAVYYTLSLDQLVLPIGKWIYPYPFILKTVTVFVYYLELIGPFLLFIPIQKNLTRLIFFSLFVSFHLGLSLTLFIGFFPAIVIAVLIAFIPSNVMDKVESVFRKIKLMHKTHASENSENTLSAQPNVWRKNISRTFLILLIIHQLAWNFKSVGWISSSYVPFQTLSYNLRLDQSWGMFAPGVFKEDGWFIFEGITFDGRLIDITRDGKPVRYGKPEQISSMFKNDRWRKYTENMLMQRNHELRFYFTAYLYDKWMQRNPDKPIKGIRIIYMKEFTLPNYAFSEPKREVLVEWVKK